MPPLPRLREIREWRALSLRELGDRAGVAYATLWRLEQGQGAQPRTIRKLATALGVEPADLMGPMPGGAGRPGDDG
jgi:transcriptional regulator with XRE-family HTH domain